VGWWPGSPQPLGAPGSAFGWPDPGITDARTRKGLGSSMPSGLRRYHHSGQSHFLTFSCYHREARFQSATTYDLFLTWRAAHTNVRVKPRVAHSSFPDCQFPFDIHSQDDLGGPFKLLLLEWAPSPAYLCHVPFGLKRYSGQSHFITFSTYHRLVARVTTTVGCPGFGLRLA
jgi:hypothetical protein